MHTYYKWKGIQEKLWKLCIYFLKRHTGQKIMQILGVSQNFKWCVIACSYNAYVIDYKLTLGIWSEHDREMIFGHIYYIHVYLISMCLQL